MPPLTDAAALERVIGHSFADPKLLSQALSHRSHGSNNNERLEFLGDAALGFIVAEWLYDLYPQATESELTLMRASLVRRRSLAAVARQIDLGRFLLLGPGERSSGGHHRESILADALEAVLGAVLKDGGVVAAVAVLRTLFADRIGSIDPSGAKDPKTRLQEWLQARGHELPRYEVIAQQGDAHAPSFRVACAVDSISLAVEAEGGSRRDAEKAAARIALSKLEVAGDH